MPEVTVNASHHQYADRMGESHARYVAKLVQPLQDILVVLDKTYFLLSSGFENPTITKNQKEWDVFHFLFCRGMKTFRSLGHLIHNGCDQDSLSLLRNLIETALTTKFIAGAETTKRAERFRDFTIVEKYRNMAGYRAAHQKYLAVEDDQTKKQYKIFADFERQFPSNRVQELETGIKQYTQKYKVKYSDGLNWAKMKLYDMASQPEVDMLHDYLQAFATFSMFTHSSFQARDAYEVRQNGKRGISWAPTTSKARIAGLLSAGFMIRIAESCIAVMGIKNLDDLLTEIRLNVVARQQAANYGSGKISVTVVPGSWGVLRRDSATGDLVI